MAFQNQPQMKDSHGNNKIRRYVHQPLTFDHFDTHCQIQSNGRIKLNKPVRGSDEYDEIEIPASLVFKLVTLLKATRKSEYVSVTEVPEEELKELKEQQEG